MLDIEVRKSIAVLCDRKLDSHRIEEVGALALASRNRDALLSTRVHG